MTADERERMIDALRKLLAINVADNDRRVRTELLLEGADPDDIDASFEAVQREREQFLERFELPATIEQLGLDDVLDALDACVNATAVTR